MYISYMPQKWCGGDRIWGSRRPTRDSATASQNPRERNNLAMFTLGRCETRETPSGWPSCFGVAAPFLRGDVFTAPERRASAFT
jgi:hypothetical protein